MANELEQLLGLLGGSDKEGKSIRDLLKQNEGGDGGKLSTSEVLKRLQQAAKDYASGNPFKIGDIVTPREGYNIIKAGEPCVVIEAIDAIEGNGINFHGEVNPSAPDFGRRLDLRVLRLFDEPERNVRDIMAFWCESWTFEHWKGTDSSDE